MTEGVITGNELREYLVKLAAGKLEDGILHEPRAFYDTILVRDLGEVSQGHFEVFKNGEDFPIRLTHLTGALALLAGEAVDDERNLQRIGLRCMFHNQYYMNDQFLPVPLWLNKCVATNDAYSFSSASWRFDVPFVLSARDTLLVEVALVEADPEFAQLVTVAFTGVGLLSGRPYLLSGQASLETSQMTQISPVFYTNDGSEPIVVTDATLHIAAPTSDDPDPTGDIRNLRMNVRQVGNGTNSTWCQGPQSEPNGELMPAPLWGATSGRGVVHEFPGDGIVLEPGEGLDIQVQALDLAPEFTGHSVHIGMLGYITVS
jgi:hypothetical protein